jgi:hypothetical protein
MFAERASYWSYLTDKEFSKKKPPSDQSTIFPLLMRIKYCTYKYTNKEKKNKRRSYLIRLT